jgi:2,3-dihydroxy-p-cumate/2,3-dihydroxybenzoate 3,4-dioxygenase
MPNTINLHDICYVRVGTDDLQQAAEFANKVVGLQVIREERDRVFFKSDEREHTLCYFNGDPGESVPGFELDDSTQLDAAAATLEGLGQAVQRGTAEEAERRRVREFISFKDPSGNTVEFVVRPYHDGVRFHGARDAGIQGFNHIGLRSSDPVRDGKFWTDVCQARISDWLDDTPLLRMSEIHHAIALLPSPTGLKGVQHINHQVETIDDIMRSYYWLRARNVKIVFGPGRHPLSGASFIYFQGPNRMVYEYSMGVMRIKDEGNYRPRQFRRGGYSLCMWGSTPDPDFNP